MFDFGPFLRKKREGKGLTQEKLATAVFLHPSIISRWETGGRLPSVGQREILLAIGDLLGMKDDEKNDLLVSAGLAPLLHKELDVDSILRCLEPDRWRQTYFLHKEMGWDEQRIGDKLKIAFWEVRQDLVKADFLVTREAPERSLIVSILEETGGSAADLETKRGGKLVAFTLGNRSENVITVNRICLEVLSCEPCDLPPSIEARVMPLRYEVTFRPGYLGEYVVTQERFRYAGPDADDFEVACKSPEGFKYTMRLNIYASDLATGSEFTVHSATFEIFFYKKAAGRDILRRYISDQAS